MKRWIYLSLGLFLAFSLQLHAQAPKKMNSGEIYEAIQKLNFLGSALYVAAHPDDENTRLISYLSNEMKANTAYLSLTRGDGGQNLVGPEIRELLGVIRTQELLAARRTDGGTQFFSRANDFGYSKHPDETLAIWNKEEVLSDVILAIRKWQPDIIVNRFDHRSPGRTHGHHTTSAMLSVEAFDLTNDKNIHSEQFDMVKPWQPRRLFFNTSWWFYGSRENFAKADKSKMLSVDIGVYYPVKGLSNTEIAASSRSMHKSQGFGSTGTRGTSSEYLELIKGDLPTNKDNLFDGINTTWTRVKGGEPIGKILAQVEKDFQFHAPHQSVSQLMEAYKLVQALPDGYWKNVKEKELKKVIEACLALYLEAAADDYSATPGQQVELGIEMINRASIDVKMLTVDLLPMNRDTAINLMLDNNQAYKFYKKVMLPEDLATSNAYWLNETGTLGMYAVSDRSLRGLPETPRSLKVQFNMEIEGTPISITKDVVYKRNDPVDGEVYRPFEVTPPVFTNIAEKVYVFGDESSKTAQVVVKSGKADIKGTLKLAVPDGWKTNPESYEVNLKLKGEEQTFTFEVTPPAGQSDGKMSPFVLVDGKDYRQELVLIEYDHIPTQTVLRDAVARVVKIDLEKAGEKVAYIMGAGDDIPTSLEQIGYEVTVLEDKDINVENLKQFDAVILGVRAYNTNERLKFHQPKLLEYVEQGGTMIVQYNTTRRLKVPSEKLGPYPLKLSRKRVTVEEAEVRFLKPDHAILNFPNKITQADLEGWVQERGLYFPEEWDSKYEAILSSNDPGSEALDGGLLAAKYGKGHYIYTGYSWFRELPAGVPGAFRMFANMISIGQQEKR